MTVTVDETNQTAVQERPWIILQLCCVDLHLVRQPILDLCRALSSAWQLCKGLVAFFDFCSKRRAQLVLQSYMVLHTTGASTVKPKLDSASQLIQDLHHNSCSTAAAAAAHPNLGLLALDNALHTRQGLDKIKQALLESCKSSMQVSTSLLQDST